MITRELPRPKWHGNGIVVERQVGELVIDQCAANPPRRVANDRLIRTHANAGTLMRIHFVIASSTINLSLRGAKRRGNPDEVEHASANRRCYGDEIATLRSQ